MLNKLTVFILSLFISHLVLANPLKVAFVYVSPVGDAGWTRSHDDARRHLEQVYGEQIETRIVEGVAEGAASRKVITELAESGADMIFTTSWGYMVPTQRVASMYPNTVFEHATGLRRGENLSTYATRAYEGRYLAGVLAGQMTKSNKIGYVAAYPIVEVIRGINAFTLGAKSVNPDIEVHVEWIKSWYNPAKSAAMANKLLNLGVDVMAQHTDSPEPIKAAAARGVYAIGYHTDMSAFAPQHHLASVIHDWSGIYEQRVASLKSDEWSASMVWPGLKEGAVKLASISPKVPAVAVKAVDAAKSAIISGDLKIFSGPIKTHRGRTKIRAGRVLTDDELLRMNWYVEGVKGDLRSF